MHATRRRHDVPYWHVQPALVLARLKGAELPTMVIRAAGCAGTEGADGEERATPRSPTPPYT